MSLVGFDPSSVTVERASIVSQTVGFPVILSFSVLLQSAQCTYVCRGVAGIFSVI